MDRVTLESPSRGSARLQIPGLAELYEAFAPRAGRLAYLLVNDRDLAEDIAHEAFVRVAGKLSGLRRPEMFESYLKRTVVNLCRDHWRKRSRERSFMEREGPRLTGDHVDDDSADRDAMWRYLRQLPHRQRAAIVLRYYEDLTEYQTADVLGCKVGTVKSLTSRGIAAIRMQMRGDDDVR